MKQALTAAELFGAGMNQVMHLVEKTVLKCIHGGTEGYGMITNAQRRDISFVRRNQVALRDIFLRSRIEI